MTQLVASAFLTLSLLFPVGAVAIDWDGIGQEATALLREYVAIDTTNPPGNEMAAARFLADRFEKEGIETRVFEPAPGRGVVYARLSGDGARRPVVLLNHLDVVAADPDEWKHPPFVATVDGDHLYGRGTIDCKGPAVVQAMAMIALKRDGVKLARDVIFLGTADEEKGGHQGAKWLVENHFELLGGAELMLNEGGHIAEQRGRAVYEVSAVEKTPLWLRLTAHGLPGHGSTPRGMSSVERLVRALERIRLRPRDLRVTPPVDAYYRALAELQEGERRRQYSDLAMALRDRAFRDSFLERPEDAALVQSTVSMTVLDGSSKTNVVPAEASAEIDVRLLPDETPTEFVENLREIIDDEAVEIATVLSLPPSVSPIDSPLFDAIVSVAAAEDAHVVPTVLRGFTDAHYFRSRGVTVYGFIPYALSDDDSRRMHGVDERIPLRELREGPRRLVAILKAL